MEQTGRRSTARNRERKEKVPVALTKYNELKLAGEASGSVGENKEYEEEHRKQVREDLISMTIDSYGADENHLSDITESEIGTIVMDLANRKAPE